MANKYLDDSGLAYFWGKVKTYFTGTATPLQNSGTGAVGTATKLSREDHVHPIGSTVAPASGDYLLISDTSDSDKQKRLQNAFGSDTTKFLCNDGSWAVPSGTTPSDFTGATSSAAGAHGLVPAPAAGKQYAFLTGDSYWSHIVLGGSEVANTGYQIYITLSRSATGNAGYVIPFATTSAAGMMSAADKTKLDSIINSTTGLIDTSLIPGSYDDVIEAYARTGQTELSQNWLSTASASGSALTPEAGKIYVLLNSSTNYAANDTFRWGGSTYVKLSDGSGVSAMSTSDIDTAMAAA